MEIKFLKRKKNFKKEEPKLNFNFYWELAVSVLVVGSIILGFLGYFLLLKINEDIVIDEFDTEGQIEIVRKERIDKVLEYFYSKQKRSNHIINSAPSIIDPSL